MIAATVVGNLGRDAELRDTSGGTAVLNFSVASNTKRNGEDSVTWVRCAIFGKRAESLAEYLSKGTRVACMGTLELREFEKRGGGSGQSLEMNCTDIELLGGGRRDDEEDDKPRSKYGRGARGKRDSDPAPARGTGGEQPEEDDIPF